MIERMLEWHNRWYFNIRILNMINSSYIHAFYVLLS
jgi:hypothetical protein